MNDKESSLFQSIEEDLGIKRFSKENDLSFCSRLVYSAMASWVLKLTRDRDFEGSPIDQVSKAHVTNTAKDILLSFKKLDASFSIYFRDDQVLPFIVDLEFILLNAGYFNSGNYSFYPAKDDQRICVTEGLSLIIDDSSVFSNMVGIGTYGPKKNGDILFDDFFIGKASAKECFLELVGKLGFTEVTTTFLNQGKKEVYNAGFKRWDSFSMDRISESEYLILRVDNMSFSLIKNYAGKSYRASFPEIYNKTSIDKYYGREIWRIILGMCSYLGFPGVAEIRNFLGSGMLIDIGDHGYIHLPKKEEVILRCLSWPLMDCRDSFQYIIYPEFYDAVKIILKRLSFEIDDER